MTDQFCPSCGTEVDADAHFCPTCGQTLDAPADDVADEAMSGDTGEGEIEASPIPAAPAWPPSEPAREPEPEAEPESEPASTAAPPDAQEGGPSPEPELAPAKPEDEEAAEGEDAEGAGPPPIPAWRQQAPGAAPVDGEPPGPPPGTPPSSRQDDLPITLPTTLSGWLIGGGSAFAALALLPRLASVLNVLIFVALLWIVATVFLADRLPRFEHQRLATLVTVMVALGAGLDRAAFTVRGADTIFLVMALIAATGVLLVELDIDRPLPPSSGPS